MTALRRAGRCLYRLLAAIGLITVLVLSTPLVEWWVRAYAGPAEEPKIEPRGSQVLILLAAAGDDHGGISYSSYWRARQTVFAWQTGGYKEIVICGFGDPGILNFLVAEGIPRAAIVTEGRSKSTRENAMETLRLLQNLPERKVLLTSDFHIFRARRVFRKLGIEAAPMAAPDLLHSTEHWEGRFSAFETMVTESAKIAYYGLRGWI
jgi:uncharacterized SAM-binding protein YcdF (DUF218 family)